MVVLVAAQDRDTARHSDGLVVERSAAVVGGDTDDFGTGRVGGCPVDCGLDRGEGGQIAVDGRLCVVAALRGPGDLDASGAVFVDAAVAVVVDPIARRVGAGQRCAGHASNEQAVAADIRARCAGAQPTRGEEALIDRAIAVVVHQVARLGRRSAWTKR